MKYILICTLFLTILEASSIKTRALHLVIRGGENLGQMKELVLLAKDHHFNTLILMLANGVVLDSLHGVYKKKVWTKKDFKSFIHFAQINGLVIIPELKLLTHQEKLFMDAYPEFMLNKTTYDPKKQVIYQTIFSIMDEIIELTNCKIFHIGHDEVTGYDNMNKKRNLSSFQPRITRNDFYNDIVKIHTYLKNKKIKTMIWGDMLIAPKEFPNMKQVHLHGAEGFSDIRKKLPKDIIIADWHYFGNEKEFPSYKMFHDEGFTVFGSTWKGNKTTENFTKYVSDLNLSDSGMIATTWYIPTGKENTLVKNIIKFSGEVFWNAK